MAEQLPGQFHKRLIDTHTVPRCTVCGSPFKFQGSGLVCSNVNCESRKNERRAGSRFEILKKRAAGETVPEQEEPEATKQPEYCTCPQRARLALSRREGHTYSKLTNLEICPLCGLEIEEKAKQAEEQHETPEESDGRRVTRDTADDDDDISLDRIFNSL